MAKGEDWSRIERGVAAAMREGGVSVPALLLRLYKAMKLSDTEAMLLIQLLAFKEKEGKEFPTPEELQSRMSAPPEQVIRALQRLMKDDLLQIDEDTDPVTGVMGERYNLMPMYRKLAAAWLEESRQNAAAAQAAKKERPAPAKPDADDMFTVFEKEFARPLTPMECETITQWLDRDKHPEELIRFALKEAVFAGVINFRYIDRILLEWSRNRVQTPEQAREYTQKFRGTR
ncbi:DnaD domain protein [Paenibacillus flagellatus]|uniref:DNA replication protein DnaD n=1 Tax=Paenibacillus flagellatus TaxID=2211139 RepID=A0A2V5KY93_9BACL|nr:DnaD domain protein [Paenibacillus flagellatus]PYI54866.1 DNA replication protein DnaD [Paenibacillus flagellatus]